MSHAEKILRRLDRPAAAGLKGAIEGATVVKVQNVADYFYDGSADAFGGWDSIPTPIPPWPLAWCEWQTPEFVTVGAERRRSASRAHVGLLVESREVDRGWLVNLSEFTSACGFTWSTIVSLSIDGTVTGQETRASAEAWGRLSPAAREAIGPTIGLSAKVALLAFSFANCRNVECVEHRTPAALRASRLDRRRASVDKFYTIEIRAITKVLDSEGRRAEVGLDRALHICRGHFKSYDEKPLFGRLRGRFWFPSHVRGTGAAGTIHKDYSIAPPHAAAHTGGQR